MSKINISFQAIDGGWDQQIKHYNIDIYHLSGWLKASSSIDKGQPKGLVADYQGHKVFFPIIVRSIDDDYWDATSTYGYGGPIVDPKLSPDAINDIMRAVTQFLYQKGCVSWFIRLHPILNKAWAVTVGETVEHGPTLVSDLTKTAEQHWHETQKQHRRGIRKALRAGVTARIEKISKKNVQVFAKIYRETMTSVGASEFYLFDDSYFYKLCENLPNRLLVITAYKEQLAIASSIQTLCSESKIMQFHLGGTLDDFRKLQPSKLITQVARSWGREAGYKYFHLGGGLGANIDTLYAYKKGFSSAELTFKTHRIIANPEKYYGLIAATEHIDHELATDFFPLYRMPAPAVDLLSADN